jgi:hypothetical protein
LGFFEHSLFLLVIHGIWQSQSALKELRIIQPPQGALTMPSVWELYDLRNTSPSDYSAGYLFTGFQ